MSCHRLSVVGVFSSVFIALVLVCASAAPAVETHKPSASFGSAGSAAGELSSPSGLAVNSFTHRVYVADTGNDRIDEFEANGTFVRAWGWGVADGFSEQFQTCTLTCFSGRSGSGPGEFESPVFVAVDSSGGASAGDVYVADNGDRVVTKFSESGALIESWGVKGQLSGSPGGSFGEIAGIAVDLNGALSVLNTGSSLFTFAQDGSFDEEFEVARGTSANGLAVDAEGNLFKTNGSPSVEEITGTNSDIGQVSKPESATGIGVDSATNGLYVTAGASVEHYAFSSAGVVSESGGASCAVEPSTGCPATDTFGSGALNRGVGIGVDTSNESVYVADSAANTINVFVPALLPDARTEAASNVQPTAATLNGTVNPAGTATTYQFEYGTSQAYGSLSPASATSVGSDSSDHALSAELTGLASDTLYHYRIVASNSEGTNRGLDETFQTTGPPTVGGQFANEITRTTASVGATLDAHGFDTHYHVEYGTTTSYGSSTQSTDIGSEPVEQSDSVQLTGLKVGTTYHYRVVAVNSQGTVAGSDQTFATLVAAPITEESYSNVGSSTVTVSATIDALSSLTTYSVEYGQGEAYTASTPQTNLGASQEPVRVVVRLEGLQPQTTYRFRFVASNAFGTAAGADTGFTTASSALVSSALPDKREYELVSGLDEGDVYVPAGPPTKVEDTQTEFPFRASSDGNALAYIGEPTGEAGSGSSGKGEGNQYLATRGSHGWTVTNITPPASFIGTHYQAFSADLSQGIVWMTQSESLKTEPEGPSGCDHPLYSRTMDDGAYHALFTGTNTPENCGHPKTADISDAGSDILFQTEAALTPEAIESNGFFHSEECWRSCNLYDSADGKAHLVNVLPSGIPDSDATFGGPSHYLLNPPDFSHIASDNGNRVIWTALDSEREGRIYLRLNPTEAQSPLGQHGECTVSTDACTIPVSLGAAQFWTATANDNSVIYVEDEKLWVFSLDGGAGPGRSELTGEGSGVQGVVGANELGTSASYIYFVAHGALDPRENANKEEARQGQDNLYLWDKGHTTFIAAFAEKDNGQAENLLEGQEAGSLFGDWQANLSGRTAEVTPDGRHLVFESVRPLTGYDTSGLVNLLQQTEVYTYGAEDNRLFCLSCDPSGTPAIRQKGELEGGRTYLPITPNGTYVVRVVSEDGSRVFFDSSQPLVPTDTNGVQDVYEWEREGTSGCPAQTPVRRLGGCVFLLTGGDSSDFSYLIDASANGDDVFVTHRGRLGQVGPRDDRVHAYDVRVDGGFAESSLACTGTGCQGVPPAPPIFATPSSVTFNGVGNFTGPVPSEKPSARSLTRAQKLATALKACRKKPIKERSACERQAKRRYGGARSKRAKHLKRGGNRHDR